VNPIVGVILLALVLLLIGIEFFSNRAMKKLGIEPTPAAKWLRIVNLVAVVLVVGFALWIVLKS
jgi:uncharacterized membrane protein